jgi:hypothetical protein
LKEHANEQKENEGPYRRKKSSESEGRKKSNGIKEM